MFRRAGLEKRLRKISKQEVASAKVALFSSFCKGGLVRLIICGPAYLLMIGMAAAGETRSGAEEGDRGDGG